MILYQLNVSAYFTHKKQAFKNYFDNDFKAY